MGSRSSTICSIALLVSSVLQIFPNSNRLILSVEMLVSFED